MWKKWPTWGGGTILVFLCVCGSPQVAHLKICGFFCFVQIMPDFLHGIFLYTTVVFDLNTPPTDFFLVLTRGGGKASEQKWSVVGEF